MKKQIYIGHEIGIIREIIEIQETIIASVVFQYLQELIAANLLFIVLDRGYQQEFQILGRMFSEKFDNGFR